MKNFVDDEDEIGDIFRELEGIETDETDEDDFYQDFFSEEEGVEDEFSEEEE